MQILTEFHMSSVIPCSRFGIDWMGGSFGGDRAKERRSPNRQIESGVGGENASSATTAPGVIVVLVLRICRLAFWTSVATEGRRAMSG